MGRRSSKRTVKQETSAAASDPAPEPASYSTPIDETAPAFTFGNQSSTQPAMDGDGLRRRSSARERRESIQEQRAHRKRSSLASAAEGLRAVDRASSLRRDSVVDQFFKENEQFGNLNKAAPIESLDYDEPKNVVYIEETQSSFTKGLHQRQNITKWVLHLLIGVFTASAAALIAYGVEGLVHYKFEWTFRLLEQGEVALSYILYSACCCALILVSTLMVIYVAPAASGSGIPEVKAYLNGSNLPGMLHWKSLLTRIVGLTCSVASGIYVGKEGPLVHVGAIIAAALVVGPGIVQRHTGWGLRSMTPFMTDAHKRDFIACGAAAGVAAAFSAPIGGVLFTLEEAASFWSPEMTWRSFFSTTVAALTLQVIMHGVSGRLAHTGFVVFQDSKELVGFEIWELPLFVCLGVIGGIMGALFNYLNIKLNRWRSQHLNRKKLFRIVEAVGICWLTASMAFLIPSLFECIPVYESGGDALTLDKLVQFTCPPGFYNDMATLMFTTSEEVISVLFSRHTSGNVRLHTLGIYCMSTYFLTIITFGTAVPSGIFIPTILIGASYGRLLGQVVSDTIPFSRVDPGVYSLIGACSMLGGFSRMTVSLTVIILEVTNDLQFLLPIMLSLMMSKYVGDRFNPSLYDSAIEMKGCTYLEPEPERITELLTASDIMERNVRVFRRVERVSTIVSILNETDHNGFPVVDNQDDFADVDSEIETNNFVGVILRSQLNVLLRKRVFVSLESVEDPEQRLNLQDFTSPRTDRAHHVNVDLSDEELGMFIDLELYMDSAPFTVLPTAQLRRVHRLFRLMGLRHLCVVNHYHEICGIITRHDLHRAPEVEHRLRRLETIYYRDSHIQMSKRWLSRCFGCIMYFFTSRTEPLSKRESVARWYSDDADVDGIAMKDMGQKGSLDEPLHKNESA